MLRPPSNTLDAKKAPVFMHDAAALVFQQLRKRMVQYAAFQYPTLDVDTLDGLYTDCWRRIQIQLDVRVIKQLRAYITRTYQNAIKDHLRDTSRSHDLFTREQQYYLGDPRLSSTDENSAQGEYCYEIADTRPAETLAEETTAARVQAALSGIPRTIRLVGEWYYVDNTSMPEIAQRLGFAVSYVFKMLTMFRTDFKKRYLYLLAMENE